MCNEVQDARVRGDGERWRFRLSEVRLEFSVEMSREGGAEAGIKLWVVSVDAKGGVSSTRSNTISVSMVPQVRCGSEWVDAYASDDENAGRPPAWGSRLAHGAGKGRDRRCRSIPDGWRCCSSRPDGPSNCSRSPIFTFVLTWVEGALVFDHTRGLESIGVARDEQVRRDIDVECSFAVRQAASAHAFTVRCRRPL